MTETTVWTPCAHCWLVCHTATPASIIRDGRALCDEHARATESPETDEDRPFPIVAAIGVGVLSGAVLLGIPIGMALWPIVR